jgi:hypothetical protein
MRELKMEERTDGRRVFYIDVSDISPKEATKFIEKVKGLFCQKRNCKKKRSKDEKK